MVSWHGALWRVEIIWAKCKEEIENTGNFTDWEISTLVSHGVSCVMQYVSSVESVQCRFSVQLAEKWVFSVQLAELWGGRKEGWQIIYGLDSGKCLVFLDIFTFITRASMIYRLSLSELIKFQTFLDCCVQCLSVIKDHHHIYLRVSDMTHPILHLLSGPGAADHDGGAPQPVLGRVWVARVIPSQLSQSEASIEPSDQSEPSHHSSHRHVGTQKQSAIDHRQI